MKRKTLKITSLLAVLSLVLTSSAIALDKSTLTSGQENLPEIVEASLQDLDITLNNDILSMCGKIEVGTQSVSFSSDVKMYKVESNDSQNGKYIADILPSASNQKLINLSFGKPAATTLTRDTTILAAEKITRIALYDVQRHRIYSVEQPSDFFHLQIVEAAAQTVSPSDDLYITLIQNEAWYNNIYWQQKRNTTEYQIIVDNDSENIQRKSAAAYTDQMVDPEEVRRSKSEYETLETPSDILDKTSVSQNTVAGFSATSSSLVDSEIIACVNYIGQDRFKVADKIYERTPTTYDPTGYYMQTTEMSCDYTDCIQNNPNCKPVETRIIGYQVVNMAPNDDVNHSSFSFIRLDIIWSYDIWYYPCHNHIELVYEDSGFRFRNMRLAMNTDEDSTDFFYRMIANSRTRTGSGKIENPAVNMALKVIPKGKYISLGINVWNNLYTVASGLTANGSGGSADRSWSSVPATHQQQMLALTGDTGYNRLVSIECMQEWDDNWLAAKGHYIYLDAYVQSTGAVARKYIQYSYKFEICTQNVINVFYTIKTVNNYFYRSYCR